MSNPEHLLPKAISDLDISIINYEGEVFNVTPELNVLTIQESLESHIIYGTLELYDVVRLREDIPLIGQEKVVISYIKDKVEVNHTLAITSIEDIFDMSNLQSVRLYITSERALQNHNKYVSKTFKGPLSEIITDVYKENFGLEIDNKERSVGLTQYIAPTIPPFDIIEKLLPHLYSGTFSPFVFFQTVNSNKLNLVSLQSLFEQDAILEYNADPQTSIDNNPLASIVAPTNKNKFTEISKDRYFDVQDLIGRGLVSARTIKYDLSKKTYDVVYHEYQGENIKKDYTSRFGRTLVMGSNDLAFPGTPSNLIGSDPAAGMQALAEYNERDLIVVSGKLNSNGKLNVGSCIDIQLNSAKPHLQDNDGRDQIVSGKYLINRLTHIIRLDEYKCEGQFIKNKMG